MTTYLGLDYGSSMLKLATTDSGQSEAALVNLHPSSPFLRSAIQLSEAGQLLAIGWDASRHRLTPRTHFAVNFRDRLVQPGSSLDLGGRSYDAVGLQQAFFAGLGSLLQPVIPTPGPLAVAIPNHWTQPAWSLPKALHQAHWRPSLLVREWCGVLAQVKQPPCEHLLMISMGFGSSQLTLCQLREGTWRAVSTETLPSVSGLMLRKRLMKLLIDEAMIACRRDPREDAEADVLLQDAVDRSLIDLCQEEETILNVNLFNRPFHHALSLEKLGNLCEGMQSPLVESVQRLLQRGGNLASCPMVAWGELALLLPVQFWLAPFLPSTSPLSLASMDIVALGSSQLCRAYANGELPTTGSASPQDGQVFYQSPGNAGGGIPLCETLPERLATPLRNAWPTLILTDGSTDLEERELRSYRIRLGRDERSEWVFEDDRYPSVSAAHAIVVRDGSQYIVRDLESTNGTYVNGSRVPRHVLQHNDVIRLGRDGPRIRFELPN